jgi:hypothetical protein
MIAIIPVPSRVKWGSTSNSSLVSPLVESNWQICILSGQNTQVVMERVGGIDEQGH